MEGDEASLRDTATSSVSVYMPREERAPQGVEGASHHHSAPSFSSSRLFAWERTSAAPRSEPEKGRDAQETHVVVGAGHKAAHRGAGRCRETGEHDGVVRFSLRLSRTAVVSPSG